MGLLKIKPLFDKSFLLDDSSLIFKNCIGFDYSNIYNDNFVVQGFCISKDYCMISAYSKFRAKSRVYLYEKNGIFCKYIELDNTSHVGGITYDYNTDIIYITGSFGNIDAYYYSEFISGNLVKYDSSINISDVISGVTSAATVYFYDNKLYVCTFEAIGKMVIYDLSISNKKIKILNYKLINNLPSAIQGVCVFKYKNNIYYLFSQSYSKLNSIIKLFDSDFTFLGQLKLKEIGIEGIDLDYSGNICSIFENGIDRMKRFHVSSLVYKFRRNLEKKYYLKGKQFQEKLVDIK